MDILYLNAFNFNGLLELEASLRTLKSAPDVEFEIRVDTGRQIPAIKVFNCELFKSFNYFDF